MEPVASVQRLLLFSFLSTRRKSQPREYLLVLGAGHVCMCGRGAGIQGVAMHESVLPRPGQGHTCGGLQGPGCECACSSNSSRDMDLGEAVAALEVGCGHARGTGGAGVWGKGMHGATAPLRSMVCTQWHQAQAWARASAPAQGGEQGTPSLWGCSSVNFRQLRQRSWP